MTAPAWLLAAFPGHEWQTLSSCCLRVKPEGGAGLDLEASELGYLVEEVEQDAGQAACLKRGSMLVAIEGTPLIGLDEDALSEAFGQNFRDGAQVLVLASDELQGASKSRGSSGSLAHISLGGTCSPDVKDVVARDLATLAASKGVVAEICGTGGKATPVVVLAGSREKVCAARPELGALLAYHGLGCSAATADAAPAVDGDIGATNGPVVEVAGTVMRSLPARNRRKRKAPEEEEEEAEDAKQAKKDAEAGKTPEREAKGDVAGSPEPQEKELHQYEYMDHTADVILHSWGTSLNEAIAQVCVCFFSYMTELEKLDIKTSVEVEASGHDMLDMLYHLLDEFLFTFGTTFVMCRRVEILSFDQDNLKIRARGWGDKFDLAKHPQGTEIKAITMHQMKILTPETLTTEEGVTPRTSDAKEGGGFKEGFPYECYVLVDI